MPHPSHRRTSTAPAFRSRSPFTASPVAASPPPDTMPRCSKLVYLMGRHPATLQPIETLLHQLKCEVQWVAAADQIYRVGDRRCLGALPPCLVIVADSDPQWAQQSVQQLRQVLDANQVTIITVSDRPDFIDVVDPALLEDAWVDGHLVNPIQRSVLGSLVHSASVRQFFHLMTMR